MRINTETSLNGETILDEDEYGMKDHPQIELSQHLDPAVCDDLMDTLFYQVPGLPDYHDSPALFDANLFLDDVGTDFMLPRIRMGIEVDDTQDALPTDDQTVDNALMRSRGLRSSLLSSAGQEGFAVNAGLAKFLEPLSSSLQTRLPSPSKTLNDPATILVEFYFKETAQLFSCYDSSMNPFRTTVSRLWNSSRLLYRTLQSMAAANLIEQFPRLGILGRQFRDEAIAMLNVDDSTNESSNDIHASTTSDTLLAMLMLGGTASWHDPRDLGLSFFNRIRRKLTSIGSKSSVIDYQFFHQCMTYWELLLSYVADNEQLEALEFDSQADTQDYVCPDVVPHPWTGFARDTQNAVQKVGRLIRQQRKLAFSRRFTSLSHIKQLEMDMATASELEAYLSNMCHPLESSVFDPKDQNTPVWQLLALAEAYRSTGLIQIYHIFPDVLDRRLARDGYQTSQQAQINPGDDLVPAYDQRTRNEYLTAFALRVLNLMKSIPLESGTRDFQPFILVSLSSELRLPSFADDGAEDANPMANITSETIETSRMRYFIKGRLEAFLHMLPPKPIRRCLDIVNRTWELMDQRAQRQNAPKRRRESLDDTQEVYWMDVMIENGWETTMA